MRRYNKIKDIYDYMLSEIVKDRKEWMAFLAFHSKVYKHTFDDAVLIYAQRPNATFVADMKTWNQKVGRWIKKGSKSIAVFDHTKEYPALKNYFDIKDTTVRQENKFSYPSYWKINKQNESYLLKRLQKDYDISTIDGYIKEVTVADHAVDTCIPDEIDEMQISQNKSSKVETTEPPPKKKIPNTIPHRNYNKLTQIASGIMDGRYNYLKLKANSFMDLTIERLSHERLSITHYYLQNGDLMRDPDMELIINHEKETVMAATFRQDNLGIFQEVYVDGCLNSASRKYHHV